MLDNQYSNDDSHITHLVSWSTISNHSYPHNDNNDKYKYQWMYGQKYFSIESKWFQLLKESELSWRADLPIGKRKRTIDIKSLKKKKKQQKSEMDDSIQSTFLRIISQERFSLFIPKDSTKYPFDRKYFDSDIDENQLEEVKRKVIKNSKKKKKKTFNNYIKGQNEYSPRQMSNKKDNKMQKNILPRYDYISMQKSRSINKLKIPKDELINPYNKLKDKYDIDTLIRMKQQKMHKVKDTKYNNNNNYNTGRKKQLLNEQIPLTQRENDAQLKRLFEKMSNNIQNKNITKKSMIYNGLGLPRVNSCIDQKRKFDFNRSPSYNNPKTVKVQNISQPNQMLSWEAEKNDMMPDNCQNDNQEFDARNCYSSRQNSRFNEMNNKDIKNFTSDNTKFTDTHFLKKMFDLKKKKAIKQKQQKYDDTDDDWWQFCSLFFSQYSNFTKPMMSNITHKYFNKKINHIKQITRNPFNPYSSSFSTESLYPFNNQSNCTTNNKLSGLDTTRTRPLIRNNSDYPLNIDPRLTPRHDTFVVTRTTTNSKNTIAKRNQRGKDIQHNLLIKYFGNN